MRLAWAFVALVFLGVFPPSASALTIDDFDETEAPMFFSSAGTQTVFGTDTAPAGDILGGFREATASQAGAGSMSVIDGGSVLDLATTVNVVPGLTVTYDGNSTPGLTATGLGGVNLAGAGPGLQFDANVSANVRMAIVVLTDATHSSQAIDPTGGAGLVLTPSATGLRHYTIPFSAFGMPGSGGPANFASVGAVQLSPLTAPNDLDLTLDNLQTLPPVAVALPPVTFATIGATIAAHFVLSGSKTKVDKLLASGLPAGSSLSLRCTAKKGCPFKSKSVTPSGPSAELKSFFKNSKLRAGTTVEVRITAPGKIGKVVRYSIHNKKHPTSSVLCLPPGAVTPTAC